MGFWEDAWVVQALVIAGLLLVAELVRGTLPGMTRLGVPACILGGVLGLVLGPDVLAWLPLNRPLLEVVVYHGLAVVFIAISLQSPVHGGSRAGARSIAFGVPFVMALQAAIGLGIVLLLGGLHPGFGFMLALGFEQGPGQALSLGAAWESVGMVDGAQVGLIMAALGFVWSIVVGVPLVAWGRARGHVGSWGEIPAEAEVPTIAALPAGALDRLTRQLVAIGGVYLLTWIVCLGLAAVFGRYAPTLAPMVWGFHFIVGAALAMGVRVVFGRLGGSPLDDLLLGRIAGLTVDVMTVASLAAVQIAVLRANLLPLMLVTTVGGTLTLITTVWLSRRAFPEAWFEHCVVWFGMSTGTLPMGLALLRIVDPELRSPAPMSAVVGSAGAVLPSIPVLLVLMPATVAAWPEGWPVAGWLALSALVVFMLVLLVAWRLLGPLRFSAPDPVTAPEPAAARRAAPSGPG